MTTLLAPPPTDREVSVEKYLRDVPRGFEYVDGRLEELPMPTEPHDFIMRLLSRSLEEAGGMRNVANAGYRARTRPRRYREPDLLYVRDLANKTYQEATTVDLAIEIVSDSRSDRERDYETKTDEYAAAGFPEYWIVDPAERRITVLTLADGEYVEHAVCGDGDVATSIVLPAFSVDVTQLFDTVGA